MLSLERKSFISARLDSDSPITNQLQECSMEELFAYWFSELFCPVNGTLINIPVTVVFEDANFTAPLHYFEKDSIVKILESDYRYCPVTRQAIADYTIHTGSRLLIQYLKNILFDEVTKHPLGLFQLWLSIAVYYRCNGNFEYRGMSFLANVITQGARNVLWHWIDQIPGILKEVETIGTYKGFMPLSIALLSGHIDIFHTLKARGMSLDDISAEGDTALSAAIELKKIDFIKGLVEAGACLTQPIRRGNNDTLSPLALMLRKDFEPGMDYLLQIDPSIIEQTYDFFFNRNLVKGSTVLFHSIVANKPNLVKLLLGYRADTNVIVNIQSSENTVEHWSPLGWAVECNLLSIADMLLSFGADPDSYLSLHDECMQITPLGLSAKHGDYAMLKLLLSHDADPYLAVTGKLVQKSISLLTFAILHRNFSAVKALLEYTQILSNTVVKPLDRKLACIGVELLQGNEGEIQIHPNFSDISKEIMMLKGCSPLYIATLFREVEIVECLLRSATVAVNQIMLEGKSEGETALYCAAEIGDLTLVNLLIKQGADVHQILEINLNDEKVKTHPLDIAIGNGHLDVVDALLKAGVSPNLPGKNPLPLLKKAILNGRDSIAKRLILAGAMIDQPDQRQLILLLSIEQNLSAFLQFLIELQWVSLDEPFTHELGQNVEHMLPVMVALVNQDFVTAKLLLEKTTFLDYSFKKGVEYISVLRLILESNQRELLKLMLTKAPHLTGKELLFREVERGAVYTTPLIYSIERQKWHLVNLLISLQAPVDQVIQNGTMAGLFALFFAAYHGNVRLVEQLLILGAFDRPLINGEMAGYTAYKIAHEQAHHQVIAIFQAHHLSLDSNARFLLQFNSTIPQCKPDSRTSVSFTSNHLAAPAVIDELTDSAVEPKGCCVMM